VEDNWKPPLLSAGQDLQVVSDPGQTEIRMSILEQAHSCKVRYWCSELYQPRGSLAVYSTSDGRERKLIPFRWEV